MLAEEILTRIKANPLQRISFNEYMGLALYHPKWGYYNRGEQKIGREGDFYTSSSVGKIYGIMWAKHFVQTWQQLGLLDQIEQPLVILEIGGGNGNFAKAVLDELQQQYPEHYQRLYYYICEQSEYHRSLQREKLSDHMEHLYMFQNLIKIRDAPKGKPTIIFSNELFDALPVDRIKRNRNGFVECWISFTENRLVEMWVPLENAALERYLEESKLEVPIGYTVEIALDAKDVYNQMSQLMSDGYIFTVDYGWTNEELLRPERKNGTLMGYFRHQHVSNVLLQPGDIDITTHVHFDDLIAWGAAANFETISYCTQREWLLNNQVLDHLQGHQDPNPFSHIAKQNRAILQLITPGGMGDTFKVLTQKRFASE